MTGFEFARAQFRWPELPEEGSFLWIWHADKIPPHIGISTGAHYYSLTYKVCELAKPVEEMRQKAIRAKIPLVLVDVSRCDLDPDFRSTFAKYDRAETPPKAAPEVNKATCLTPIRALFGLGDNIRQLSDLLTEIQNSGKLQEVFVLHLDPTYRGIPAYSVTEIMQRIEQLHEANRQKSTTSSR